MTTMILLGKQLRSERLTLALLLTTTACLLYGSCRTDDANRAKQKGSFLKEPLVNKWPEGIHPEGLRKVNCPTNRCFVVEPHTELCSIDPVEFRGGNPFGHKAKLHIQSGVFPLPEAEHPDISGLGITLETKLGKTQLVQTDKELGFRVDPIDPKDPFSVYEWILILGAVRDSEEKNRFDSLKIRSPYFHDLWNQHHFRLGNPKDGWWWYNNWRHVSLSSKDRVDLLPDKLQATLSFGPCTFPEGKTLRFVFDLVDDDEIELSLQYTRISTLVGFTAYRLTKAIGRLDGKKVEIEDYFDTAVFGGGTGKNLKVPVMALRFEDLADNGSFCGLFLAPKSHNSGDASGGWDIRQISCDNRLGASLEYDEVVVPEQLR